MPAGAVVFFSRLAWVAIGWFWVGHLAFAQQDNWAFSPEMLVRPKPAERALLTDSIWYKLANMRLAKKRSHLATLRKGINNADPEVAARSKMIWARLQPFDSCEVSLRLLRQTEQAAMRQNNDLLLAESFFALGETHARCGPNEQALLFFMKSLALRQQVGLQYFADNHRLYYQLGGLYFRIGQYREAVWYMQLCQQQPSYRMPPRSLINALHVAGLSYLQLGQTDSAAYWFGRCRSLAVQLADSAWIGISEGNHAMLALRQGRVGEAKQGFISDYRAALRNRDSTRAGDMLQQVARIYLGSGPADSALPAARQAFSLVWNHRAFPNAQQRLEVLHTLNRALAARGLYAEAYQYSEAYNALRDSLTTVQANSRIDWVSTRLQWEKAESQKQSLMLQHRAEKRLRWALLLTLLLLMLAAWLYYRRRAEQHRSYLQQLQHEKQLAQNEATAAKNELDLLTQAFVQKSTLIEEVSHLPALANTPDIPYDLLQHTLLTDADWVRFKGLFVKVYPAFFDNLKKAVPEISPAELRLATLLKLGVGNKHIASMLGMSPDSVRKSKSRLRQRLGLQPGQEIEAWIEAL